MSAEDELRAQVRAALRTTKTRQVHVARETGMSEKHLSQMLTGRVHLTVAHAEQILATCGARLAITVHLATPEEPPAMTDATDTQPQITGPDAGRMLGHISRKLNAERAAHEAHRLALSTALHLGTSAPWDAIQDRAETVQAGDAPWVRAYGEDIAAAEERADRAEAMLARVREIAEPATRYDDVSQDKLASSILAALDPVPEPHVDWRDIAAQREDTIGRVRALAVRLDGFPAVALTESDRRLYAALASDVRAALTGPHAAETAAQPDDADRIVADRGRDGRLYCTRCTPPSGEPLTSEDLPDGGICTACGTDVLAAPEPMARERSAAPNLAAIRQPAYDAVSAYISTLPSEGVTALPSSTVTRNAMIWRGVNAALDAMRPADATVTVTMPASAHAALRAALGGAA